MTTITPTLNNEISSQVYECKRLLMTSLVQKIIEVNLSTHFHLVHYPAQPSQQSGCWQTRHQSSPETIQFTGANRTITTVKVMVKWGKRRTDNYKSRDDDADNVIISSLTSSLASKFWRKSPNWQICASKYNRVHRVHENHKEEKRTETTGSCHAACHSALSLKK